MIEKTAVSIEKKLIAVALVISAGHMILIAYAAYALGINVPGCTKEVKPFTAGSLTKQGDNRYELHVLAKMWSFEPSRIVVPLGSVVDVYLTSKDVTHGFHINNTNVNLTAVPFVVNYAQVKFKKPGIYPIICHEYCGSGHHHMSAFIDVRSDVNEASAEGLPEAVPEGGAQPRAKQTEQAPQEKMMMAKGCLACHSLTGEPGVGPSFKGLFGRQEDLADGNSVNVDEEYLRESIIDPQKKIVKGFQPVMPKIDLKNEEIDQIVNYLKELK